MRFTKIRFLPVLSLTGLLGSALVAGINANAAVTLPGTANPGTQSAEDLGRMAPATPLDGMTMYFQPTAEQQAELDALVKAQQTPGSPEYHQWLTPAAFASLFGLSNSDMAKVEAWLQSQGFTVERVGTSRNNISFSGAAAQVEAAF